MYIIGIHDGHHAGACLFKNGEIINSISEDRLTRKKNEYGFPLNSIKFCLKKEEIKKHQISYIAVSTNYLPPKYLQVKRNTSFKLEDYKKEQEKYWYSIFYKNKKIKYTEIFKNKIIRNQIYNFKLLKNEDDFEGMKNIRLKAIMKFFKIEENKIFFYDHHLCHANYALYSCINRKKISHVFTCDGGGDGSNGNIWKVENGKILKNLYRTNIADVGRIYRYFTLFLNMKPSENEFKVMGLAGYSNIESSYSKKAFLILKEVLDVKGINFFYKKKIKDLYFYFYEKFKNFRFDTIAFAVQHFSEYILLKWLKNAQKKFGFTKIAFAGGVSQNIKVIKKILENSNIDYLYVPPGAGDESLPIGAVYSFLSNKTKIKRISSLHNPYINCSYEEFDPKKYKFSNLEISKTTTKKIAHLLSNGNVVGRYVSSGSEFGPRALGNRSILADPRDSDIINFVNKKIKVRDFWMPFAPSIIDKMFNKYIKNNNQALPYHMTYSYESTSKAKQDIPAALHPFDKTTRPQVVTKKINKKYYDLIFEFYKITGVGALLNTSFNLHGEPIVSDHKSVLKTFKKSGLRYLYIDNYLLKKND